MSLREGLRNAGSTDVRHPGHHRHARQSCRAGAGRPRSQHPVLVPRQHRRHHLRGGYLGRLPGPGHRADGLAGRPLPTGAHRRLGHLRLRADGGRHGVRHQHLRVLPGPLRRRHLAVEHATASTARCWPTPIRSTCRGRIYAAMGMGRAWRGHASPLLVGLIATEVGGPNGWRWAFYILAIPILLGRLLRLPHPRATTRPIREEGRAGRGLRRYTARSTVHGGGVRADHAHPHDQDRASSPSRPSGSGSSPVPCSATSTSSSASVSTPSSAVSSAPSEVSVCCSRCPSSGATTTASTARIRRQALSLIGKVVLPVAILVPIQYFMPNAVLWAVFSVPSGRPAADRVLHDRPGAHLGGPLPPAGNGRCGRGASTSSSSGPPGARCWRRCSTASSGCGPRC